MKPTKLTNYDLINDSSPFKVKRAFMKCILSYKLPLMDSHILLYTFCMITIHDDYKTRI